MEIIDQIMSRTQDRTDFSDIGGEATWQMSTDRWLSAQRSVRMHRERLARDEVTVTSGHGMQ